MCSPAGLTPARAACGPGHRSTCCSHPSASSSALAWPAPHYTAASQRAGTAAGIVGWSRGPWERTWLTVRRTFRWPAGEPSSPAPPPLVGVDPAPPTQRQSHLKIALHVDRIVPSGEGGSGSHIAVAPMARATGGGQRLRAASVREARADRRVESELCHLRADRPGPCRRRGLERPPWVTMPQTRRGGGGAFRWRAERRSVLCWRLGPHRPRRPRRPR